MTAEQRAHVIKRTIMNLVDEGHPDLASWAEDQLAKYAAYWSDTQLTLWLAELRHLADRSQRVPHAPPLRSRIGERLGGGLTAPMAVPGPAGRPYAEQRLPGILTEV